MRTGSVGGINEIGVIPGRRLDVDPTGRYVTTVHSGTVSTYGAADLAPVASHPVGRPQLVATHPGGATVAVLTADRSLELWSAGRRVATRPLGGTQGSAWLSFTAGGGHLLAGLAAPDDGSIRLDLLDAATLDLVDTTGALPGGYPGYDIGAPPADWGEGVTPVAAPPPSDTVALAANAGDDPHVLAVVDVVDGRLCTYATATGAAFAAQVPGERIDGIALDAAETLYVLDSDDTLTAFAWRDPDRPPRRVVSGHRFIDEVFGADSGREFAGPVFVVDNRLAVPVDGGPGMVLAFLDPASGHCTGRLDIPAPWSDGFIDNGLLWFTDGAATHIAGWTA